jgi:hypothetical protein
MVEKREVKLEKKREVPMMWGFLWTIGRTLAFIISRWGTSRGL